jgi:hypothetical protein
MLGGVEVRADEVEITAVAEPVVVDALPADQVPPSLDSHVVARAPDEALHAAPPTGACEPTALDADAGGGRVVDRRLDLTREELDVAISRT